MSEREPEKMYVLWLNDTLNEEGEREMDLLVNLYDLKCKYHADKLRENGIEIRRALSPDKGKVLEFVKKYYEMGWVYETEHAFTNHPVSCYVAVKDKELIGFSCYDATAKGYFGPIAMKPDEKGRGVGPALLYAGLMGMKEAGYGYAIIGWVDEAVGFYDKVVEHMVIPGSEPINTIYQRLI